MSWPSLNALMSQQVPPDAQGELQGGLASLSSLAAVLGPPLMTQLFGKFSEPAGAGALPRRAVPGCGIAGARERGITPAGQQVAAAGGLAPE